MGTASAQTSGRGLHFVSGHPREGLRRPDVAHMRLRFAFPRGAHAARTSTKDDSGSGSGWISASFGSAVFRFGAYFSPTIPEMLWF